MISSNENKYTNILDNLNTTKNKLTTNNIKNVDLKSKTALANNYDNTNDRESFLPVNGIQRESSNKITSKTVVNKKKKSHSQCLQQWLKIILINFKIKRYYFVYFISINKIQYEKIVFLIAYYFKPIAS